MSKQQNSKNIFSKTFQAILRRSTPQQQRDTDTSRTKNTTKSHTVNSSSKSKTSNKQSEKVIYDKYSLNLIINNVAGLGVLTGKMDDILQWIDANQIDTFLGQEANVSFRHPRIQSYLRGSHCSKFHVSTSETEWIFSSPHKPGGTFCISNQRMKSRIIHRLRDPAGRWSGNIYQLKAGKKLALISMYQTVKHNTNGATSVHSQQSAWLQKAGRMEDPKTAMIKDLKQALENLQKDNILIIIGGDFNESDKKAGLHYMLSTELGLKDIFDQSDTPETHRRGSQCIDHVYMTDTMTECIESKEYLDFPKEYYTDHRPMKISLNLRILGKVAIDVPQQSIKKLQSNDIENVKTYINERFRLTRHYKIQEKLEKLSADIESIEEDKQDMLMTRINKLDDQITRICLQAERTIKSRPKYYNTQKVASLKKEITDIRYEISKKSNSSDETIRLKKKRKNLIEELRQAIKNQSKIRRQETIEKLNAIIQKGNSTAKRWALQQRSHLTVEKMRKVYGKLSYLTGKNSDKTPISVQVQKEGKTITLQDPDEIAQAFQKHNKTHFAQANGGFFNSIEVKQVVEPQKVPEIFQTNEVQEERILQILKNIQVQEIKSTIDPEEWKKKFKQWSERTRTSPSGAHLGHYKSLLKPVMDGEGETTALNTVLHNIQTILFSIQLSVVNLAIKLGKPLQRWKKAVNLVIPKIKGINNISKFRNIHIYECDLNAFLSIKWKEASYQAEESQALVSSQYGSRKAKSSHDPVQTETLLMDISRITRKTYGQINYDARACYDRILPNLASMASRSHGLPLNIVNLHFKLLNNMVFDIHIEGSTVTTQYKSEPQSPVFGTGQGSGNSPFIWTFIYNTLNQSFETKK